MIYEYAFLLDRYRLCRDLGPLRQGSFWVPPDRYGQFPAAFPTPRVRLRMQITSTHISLAWPYFYTPYLRGNCVFQQSPRPALGSMQPDRPPPEHSATSVLL